MKKKAPLKRKKTLTKEEKQVRKKAQDAIAAENAAVVSGGSFEVAETVLSEAERVASYRESTIKLLAAGTEAAARYLTEVIKDEKMSPKIRVEASKIILDRMGFSPKDASKRLDAGLQKPMHEMTIEELEDFVKEKQELIETVKYATAIDITPDAIPSDITSAEEEE